MAQLYLSSKYSSKMERKNPTWYFYKALSRILLIMVCIGDSEYHVFPEKTSEDISIFGLYMDCHKRSST